MLAGARLRPGRGPWPLGLCLTAGCCSGCCRHLSVVICGHVDSGKSTTTGRLIFELGGIPERELEKLKVRAGSSGVARAAREGTQAANGAAAGSAGPPGQRCRRLGGGGSAA
jgi:hypothetical protein